MEKTYIIVSAKYFRKFLKSLIRRYDWNLEDEYQFKVGAKELHVNSFSYQIEGKGTGEYMVSVASVHALKRVLKNLQDQPIKIGFTDRSYSSFDLTCVV